MTINKRCAALGRVWLTIGLLSSLLLLFGGQGAVLAQETAPLRLSTLEISLWPEFDRPELLVIVQGRLADDVPLPARLTLTIPRKAGEPHAVAWMAQDGALLQAAYDLQEVSDGIAVTYTALEGRSFQLEYYLDALQIKGQQRQFTFEYRLDVATDELVLELQQPAGATNVVSDPPATETSAGFAGLTYHRLTLQDLAAGQSVEWQVRYDKSGLRLSAETLPTEEAAAATPDPSLGANAAFGAVAVVGIALAAALAGLWIVGSRRQAEAQRARVQPRRARAPKPRKRKDRKGAPPRPKSLPPSAPAQDRPAPPPEPAAWEDADYPAGGFCHQCGVALKEDALFCHRCGAQRKGA